MNRVSHNVVSIPCGGCEPAEVVAGKKQQARRSEQRMAKLITPMAKEGPVRVVGLVTNTPYQIREYGDEFLIYPADFLAGFFEWVDAEPN